MSSLRFHTLRFACAVLASSAAACLSVGHEPVPDPLPETGIFEEGRPGRDEPAAWLGLRTRENLAGGLDALAFRPGLVVTDVVLASPAWSAGLRAGDLLLRWNATDTNDVVTLETLVAQAPPGETVALRVQRGDTVFAVRVEPVTAPATSERTAEALWLKDSARSRAAWSTSEGGVRLVSSVADGPFPKGGVAVGSVVSAIDGAPLVSARGLLRALAARAPGERVDVTFQSPDGKPGTARVTLHRPRRHVSELAVPILGRYAHDPTEDTTSFVLCDLWLISLLRYERDGEERRWRILRFLRFSTGLGELGELGR